VILYSGYGEGVDQPALKAAGIRTVLRKPVDPHALRSGSGNRCWRRAAKGAGFKLVQVPPRGGTCTNLNRTSAPAPLPSADQSFGAAGGCGAASGAGLAASAAGASSGTHKPAAAPSPTVPGPQPAGRGTAAMLARKRSNANSTITTTITASPSATRRAARRVSVRGRARPCAGRDPSARAGRRWALGGWVAMRGADDATRVRHLDENLPRHGKVFSENT